KLVYRLSFESWNMPIDRIVSPTTTSQRGSPHHQPPDQGQHKQREKATGRKHQPAELRCISAERLQHDGEQHGGAVQDNAEAEHEERGGGVVAIAEEMQLDDGILLA